MLYHYDVLRANKSGMAHGVEVRVPFLDHQLIDLVMHHVRGTWKNCCWERRIPMR